MKKYLVDLEQCKVNVSEEENLVCSNTDDVLTSFKVPHFN
jgi:hypothetical protein